MSCIIVISCYKKDLKWTQQLFSLNIKKIYVYDHSDIIPENEFLLNNDNYYYEKIENKGCESSAYLKYIMDNYNNLPDKIILLHDDEYTWHHVGSIVDLIKNSIDSDKPFISLNSYTWVHASIDTEGYIEEFKPNDYYYSLYSLLLEPYYGDIRNFGNFLNGHKGCAQMIITKSSIVRNSHIFYINLYNYCMSDNVKIGHVAFGFGYFMEFTWHIIFGHVLNLNTLRGTWKYSAINITTDFINIYAKLGDGRGSWVPSVILLNEEHLFHNKNGIAVK